MKTCYITGATGCVGHNLVEELLKDCWDIIALHRKSSDLSKLKDLKIRFQEVDLLDIDSVRMAIQPNADAIFHVAANTSHWVKDEPQQYKDNVIATRNLAIVALEKKAKRFLFTSTGATNHFQGEDESAAMKISESYVRTKRLAELEVYKVIKQGLDAVFLKPGIVVGAYDYQNYSQIFKMLKSKNPIKVVFPGNICFCHARSCARGHILAYEKGRSGESYEMGGPFATWLEFCQRICRIMGVPEPKHATPFFVLKPLAYFLHYLSMIFNFRPPITPGLIGLLEGQGDSSEAEKKKAYEELGYQSSSLDAMIEDCYQWMLKEKML